MVKPIKPSKTSDESTSASVAAEVDQSVEKETRPNVTSIDRMVADQFRSQEDYVRMAGDILIQMHDKYKFRSTDVATIANILGHYAYMGIEKTFKIDQTIDVIIDEVRKRGFEAFVSLKRIATGKSK